MTAAYSPFERLPPDILSEILELTLPSLSPISSLKASADDVKKQHYPLIVLGAVCTYFRRAVQAHPSLYTAFRWSSRHSGPQSINLFHSFLDLSRGHSIHLSFHFDYHESRKPGETLLHPSVDPILLQSFPRIRTLVLRQPPREWLRHLNNLSSLQDFEFDYALMSRKETSDFFDGRHLDAEGLYINQCRSLRRLSFQNTEQVAESKFYYRVPRSLPILHLTSIPIDSAFKLASRCPNLTELKLISLQQPHDSNLVQSWLGQPISYQRLEVFIWDRQNPTAGSWPDAFFTHIYMPALSSLKIVDYAASIHDMDNTNPAEALFFGRLAGSIRSLCICSSESLHDPIYDRFFSPESSVEALTLIRCDYCVLEATIQALMPNEVGVALSMPHLYSLSVEEFVSSEVMDPDVVWRVPIELGPRSLEPLALVLERRFAPGDRFRVEFSGVMVDWTFGVQERLRDLVAHGVELEILEDGNPVDWLRD